MSDYATTRPEWGRHSMNIGFHNYDAEIRAIFRAHCLHRPGHRGITAEVIRNSTINAIREATQRVEVTVEPLESWLPEEEQTRPYPFVWVFDPNDDLFLDALREWR
jgi:hypothetical protein